MFRPLARIALVCLALAPFSISLAYAADVKTAGSGAASATSSTLSSTQSSRQPKATTDSAKAKPKELNPRVLFITAKDSEQSKVELARLQAPRGEFAKMKAIGWTIGTGPENMVQIVDRDAVPDLVEKMGVKEYPTVACIDHDEVVRYFRWGCTTPLDAWTFGFLAKGVDERPAGAVLESARVESTGSYPLRGNHWSVEGDWSPTREKCIEHLRGPNHIAQLTSAWHIDDWSLEELRSLHDDLHERYDAPASFNSSRDFNDSTPSYAKVKGRS